MATPYSDFMSPQNNGRDSLRSNPSSTTNQTWVTSPATSIPTSSVSAGVDNRDWKRAQNSKHQSELAPRLVKIRSSPGNGILAAARSNSGHSAHGRLHKRVGSASSSSTPQTANFSPTSSEYFSTTSPPAGDISLPSPYQEAYRPPRTTSLSKNSKVKIKPFLKKIGPQEKDSIDLSRSVTETEGLGIYSPNGTGYSSIHERRGFHGRSPSGTSQLSSHTTASNQRAGTQYVHPMRQAPRPYTPPVNHSYQNSVASSDLANRPSFGGNESRSSTSQAGDMGSEQTPLAYAPVPSSRRTPPPLHIQTHSASRLTSSSQTNLPGTPSSLRLQLGSMISPDALPQTARSSFESAFRKRSRANTNTDPVVQAATVQALRAEFDAKEAAKDLKIQQAEERAREKEMKKQEKAEEASRRKSEAADRKRAKRNTTASEKSVPLSTGARSATNVHPIHLGDPADARLNAARKAVAGGRSAKSTSSSWSLFWFKFKTMWLKFKRSMSKK
ncbi:hypothetical protein MMC09_006375 [Bachmanniomyces sp. S44760]|nr:hypothetical protein [Bachmanniomyces sp. S44760]